MHAFEAHTPFEKLPGIQINVPRLNLHKRPRHRRCPTSRDFVPWRFSDAGRRSAWIAASNISVVACKPSLHKAFHRGAFDALAFAPFHTFEIRAPLVDRDSVPRVANSLVQCLIVKLLAEGREMHRLPPMKAGQRKRELQMRVSAKVLSFIV